MPDPLLYLKAMGAAAVASATVVLAMAGIRRPAGATRSALASLLAVGFGLVAGYYVLSLPLSWPPANGLDRLLTLIVPLALLVELIAGIRGVPRAIAWLLRLVLAAAIPRVLLHGSVYLSGGEDGWTFWQAATSFAACGGLMAGVWGLLSWLSQRSPGVAIPISLSLTSLCAGLTVMMAGYLNGGAAAFPLVATLLATISGSWLLANASTGIGHDGQSATAAPRNHVIRGDASMPGILGIGMVGLFGLLFIGHFFGRLSTGCAVVLLLAPLLCWASELPGLRHRHRGFVGALRLALVALLLAVVLTLAKRAFDRDMAPLLTRGPRIDRGWNAQGHRHGDATRPAPLASRLRLPVPL